MATIVITDGLQFPFIYYPACQVLICIVNDIHQFVWYSIVLRKFPYNFTVNGFLLTYDYNVHTPIQENVMESIDSDFYLGI